MHPWALHFDDDVQRFVTVSQACSMNLSDGGRGEGGFFERLVDVAELTAELTLGGKPLTIGLKKSGSETGGQS